MRERLSWDEGKEAEMKKKADPYTMNQDHKNNPVEKYDIGGPSEFAEDPDMKTPWKTEGRTETGHPAPEREAVMAARKMEDKAMKCLTIAQRMLPGASDEVIEEQATEFMYLPEKSVLSILQRQAGWAQALAGDDGEEKEEEVEAKKKAKKDEEEKPEEKEEEVEAKKKAKKDEEEKPEEKEEEVEAKKKAKKDEEEKPEEKEEEVEAKKKAKKDEEEKPEEKEEEVEAKKKAKKDEEEKPEEKEEEVEAKKKAEEKIAAEEEVDLLDSIFASEETKTGAKKLSGIVKQASADGGDLNNLWKSSTPPDVSEAFK